ncbi:MAG: hypothetical protein KF889_01115 [Alphaproteobacteria bacterium]|nr:hypothetical protein [Alphaproteobacteria bacterium]MCW5741503.1 hypothetical protein [Alphaproteobacteria bacterium]
MRLFGAIAFAAVLMVGVAARAELVNGTQFQSGNWKGAAYTNDTTRRFSHCAMSTAYRSGISMFFAISDNYTWRVGWSRTTWNLNVGQSYPVSLTVDGINAGTLQAKAVNRQFAVAELPAQATLFDLFRRGNQLTMVSGSDRFQFSLLGTSAALAVLINCTRTQLASATPQPSPQPSLQPSPPSPPPGASRPGPITVPQPADPRPTQPVAQPAPSSAPPPANTRRLWPESSAQQRVEAARTLSAILALPGMQGFRPMSEREAIDLNVAQSARADLAWRADLLTGVLDIVPAQSGFNASAIAGTIIAADRRACGGGRFHSGTAPDQRSQRVTRLFTTCEASLRTSEARYMVVPMVDGASHYVFAMVGPSFQSADGRTEVAKAADELRQAVLEVLRQ